jgi:DNA ligase-1
MQSEILYGLDKSGKFKVWQVWTEGAKLYIQHGSEGGKQTTKCEYVHGKNIGRSNETTDEQQAELEAISRYKKQRDKGYRESKDQLTELPLLPMLAHDYLKQGHRIKYPCYATAKLDGVRCLAIRHSDRVELKSRGGKEYNAPHIQQELMFTMQQGDVWDGELYIHGKFLEEIVSAIKKWNENSKDIKFIIFDIVNEKPYSERLKCAQDLQIKPNGNLEFLYPETVFNEVEMKAVHKKYVACGYEGIMLRNTGGVYESGKRSADLQKYKEFFDEEFEIIAITEDRNGNAVLSVKDDTAKSNFNVTFGDFEERKRQLLKPEDYIGKLITVKYQTRYKDSKLPQFPTGVCIRDYE